MIIGKPSATWVKYHENYLMIAPFFLIFIIFSAIPVVANIIVSLTSFNMLSFPKFIGFRNYISLFVYDDIFLVAIKNTLFFAAVTGPISYIMCFLFAWLINGLPPKVRAFMTLIFYAPSISGNAYLMWRLIFSSDSYGYANSILINLGITGGPILWFQNPRYIMPILIVVQLWLSLGVSFLAFIAGLKGVDKSLFEAGAIDGIKNRWQELWHITLPSMRPQLMFGAVMQITNSFGIAALSSDLAGFPSVEYAGHTMLLHLQDYGNIRMEMGYACAISTILFLFMVFFNLIVQKFLRRVGKT